MKQVAIFIPTYNRANNIWRVLDNLAENTPSNLYTPYIIAEKDDTASITTTRDLGYPLIINKQEPSYAGAINTAYKETEEKYFFMGADDLGFHVGWLETAMNVMGNGVYVVGTNDMGQIPIGEDRDATHFLVARQYIVAHSGRVDKPNTVLYPYQHNYVDKEFVETARSRNMYVYCSKSATEHLHPVWGKGKWDETYRKGQMADAQDRQVFIGRQHLWSR